MWVWRKISSGQSPLWCHKGLWDVYHVGDHEQMIKYAVFSSFVGPDWNKRSSIRATTRSLCMMTAAALAVRRDSETRYVCACSRRSLRGWWRLLCKIKSEWEVIVRRECRGFLRLAAQRPSTRFSQPEVRHLTRTWRPVIHNTIKIVRSPARSAATSAVGGTPRLQLPRADCTLTSVCLPCSGWISTDGPRHGAEWQLHNSKNYTRHMTQISYVHSSVYTA